MRRRRRWPFVLAGVVVALVLVGAVGTWAAERYVEARKQELVDRAAVALGRPVHAGRVNIYWWGGPGVELREVHIGSDPRQPAVREPALSAERLHVDLGLWRTLSSLGRRPQLDEVNVVRPSITVVRRPDGTLDWQELSARFKSLFPPSQPKRNDEPPQVGIGRATLEDAEVLFVDLAARGARAEVHDIDALVQDFATDEAFSAQLSAAVLGTRKNLQLDARVRQPEVERLTLVLEETELGPLAPLLGAIAPALEGLAGGRASARVNVTPVNVTAKAVSSRLQLAGARFEGGRAFDAAVAADLTFDLQGGDILVRTLRASAEDMMLEARGDLLDLKEAPRFHGFRLVSRGLSFDAIRALYPALTKTSGVRASGPFTIEARADGGPAGQRFDVRMNLTGASFSADGVEKRAGTRLVLSVDGAADGRTLRIDRATLGLGPAQLLASGRIGLGEQRRFDVTVDAQDFPVRDVTALVMPAQAAGIPAARVTAQVKANGQVGRPETMRVSLAPFDVIAGRSRVQGTAAVANLAKPKIDLDARAPYLDTDDLLPSPSAPKATGKPRQSSPSVLDQASGRVRLAVTRGRASGIDFENLRADMTLAAGQLRAQALDVQAFGGAFSGAGTELPLDGEGPFTARGRLTGMKLDALLGRFAGTEDVMRGLLGGRIELSGAGTTPDDLRRSLAGTLAGRVAEAQFLPANLMDLLSDSLSRAVQIPGLATALREAERRVPSLRERKLGDLGGALRFAGGAMELTEPLTGDTPWGPLSLRGRVGLDGTLALTGSLRLPPELAAALAGGRARFTQPVPVDLAITGPLRSPRVAPSNLTAVARVYAQAYVRESGAGVAEQMRQEVEKRTQGRAVPEDAKKRVQDEARKRLRGLLGN